MHVPDIRYPGIQEVEVKLLTKDSLFTFNADKQVVFLEKSFRDALIRGTSCPKKDFISLEFLLESDLLGTATQTIDIPVEPLENASANESGLSYSVVKDESSDDGQGLLIISTVQITATGNLTIEFSKNILPPAIRGIRSVASQDEEDINRSRVLQEVIEHDG